MRVMGLATVLTGLLSATLAHSEDLFSYFSTSDDPPGTSVTFSPCTGDEVGECISHILSCKEASRGDPKFTIVSGDIETIFSPLIADTNGQANAQLKMTNDTVNLTINSVELTPNVLNSDWDTIIDLDHELLAALTEKSSEGASLIIGGERFPLAPQKGDGKKLIAWKNACIALEGQSLAPVPAAKPECEFNSRLYRSPLRKDPDANSYQELQFTNGSQSGTTDLTEYRQGKAVWVAHGQFTCSNGASICQVNFPLTLGGPVELPYETTGDAGSSPETVVIPALRQQVYQTGRNATVQGKAYGGLAVDFLNGFKLGEDELTLPYNVYRLADCKR